MKILHINTDFEGFISQRRRFIMAVENLRETSIMLSFSSLPDPDRVEIKSPQSVGYSIGNIHTFVEKIVFNYYYGRRNI